MRQLLTRTTTGCFFGATTEYHCFFGGQNGLGWEETVSFPKVADTLCPLAGTFQNLYILSNDATHPAAVFTLQKNGVDTALTVSIGTDAPGPASDKTHSFTVAAGDVIRLKAVSSGGTVSSPGWSVAFCVEFRGTASDYQSFYGISPFQTAAGYTVGNGFCGGAFCNGVWSGIAGGSIPTRTNTYSLSSLAGNVTALHLRHTYASIGSSVWTGYIRKNGVVQDGSGGTVNTACVVNLANPYVAKTFTLPVVMGDFLEIYVILSGANAPSDASGGVGAAVIVDATNKYECMFDGGNNNAFLNNATQYLWSGASQEILTELGSKVPIGVSGLQVTGLYWEQFSAGSPSYPGASKTNTMTLVNSGVATAVTVPISGTTSYSGLITGQSVTFVEGNTAVLSFIPVNTPTVGGAHWALLMKVPFVIPNANSGIYELVPGKTNDTLWLDTLSATTTTVKIPDPFFEL